MFCPLCQKEAAQILIIRGCAARLCPFNEDAPLAACNLSILCLILPSCPLYQDLACQRYIVPSVYLLICHSSCLYVWIVDVTVALTERERETLFSEVSRSPAKGIGELGDALFECYC